MLPSMNTLTASPVLPVSSVETVISTVSTVSVDSARPLTVPVGERCEDHDALAVGVDVGTCVIEGVAIADNIARGERLVDDIERPFRVDQGHVDVLTRSRDEAVAVAEVLLEENRERVCLLDRVCVVTGDADLGVDPGLEHRLVGCDGRVGLRREVERDVAGRDVICRSGAGRRAGRVRGERDRALTVGVGDTGLVTGRNGHGAEGVSLVDGDGVAYDRVGARCHRRRRRAVSVNE